MQEKKKGFRKVVVGKITSSFEIQKEGDKIKVVSRKNYTDDKEKEDANDPRTES